MSDKYENWERLVAAVIRKEEELYFCHRSSTDSDISRSSSTSSSHLSALEDRVQHLSDDDYPGLGLTRPELASIFELIDRDEDGKVSKEEVEDLFHRLGVERNNRELQAFLRAVNSTGDGQITLESFCAVSCQSQPMTGWAESEENWEIFDTLDVNHDGLITADDLLCFFKILGDAQFTLEDWQQTVAAVDGNGNGGICFQDFIRTMAKY